MESKSHKDNALDIIGYIRYNFQESYEQKMSDITKIILQRVGVDNRAREIAKLLMVNEGIQYAEAVFDRAVEIGRFAAFDTHAMAVFINSVRIFTLYCWIVDPSPDSIMKLLADE